jgi:hypothetical protein
MFKFLIIIYLYLYFLNQVKGHNKSKLKSNSDLLKKI